MSGQTHASHRLRDEATITLYERNTREHAEEVVELLRGADETFTLAETGAEGIWKATFERTNESKEGA